MAFIGIKVSETAAKQMKKIKVPGKKEDHSKYHITILYLGKNVEIDQITSAIKAAYEVCEKFKPFEIEYEKLSCFPANDEDGGHPIILKIKSKSLMNLNKKLRSAFDDAGVEYSKRFDYNPHTTLSYSEKEVEEKDIEKIKMDVSELVIWAGDQDDEKMSITISLKNDKIANISEKAANFLKISKLV